MMITDIRIQSQLQFLQLNVSSGREWPSLVKNGTYSIEFSEVNLTQKHRYTAVGKEANEELVLDLKIVLKKDEINKHGVVYHNRPWPNKLNEICTLIPFFR